MFYSLSTLEKALKIQFEYGFAALFVFLLRPGSQPVRDQPGIIRLSG
jgi:hypothetical protein